MVSVLGVIMQLRKCCNHPNLFEPRPVISPYTAPTIAPRLPTCIFSIASENEKNDARVPIIGDISHSSLFAWQIFMELSEKFKGHDTQQTNLHESLPHVSGIKFVMDSNGGHFYKRETIRKNHDNEHQISNGVDVFFTFYELKNNEKF